MATQRCWSWPFCIFSHLLGQVIGIRILFLHDLHFDWLPTHRSITSLWCAGKTLDRSVGWHLFVGLGVSLPDCLISCWPCTGRFSTFIDSSTRPPFDASLLLLFRKVLFEQMIRAKNIIHLALSKCLFLPPRTRFFFLRQYLKFKNVVIFSLSFACKALHLILFILTSRFFSIIACYVYRAPPGFFLFQFTFCFASHTFHSF